MNGFVRVLAALGGAAAAGVAFRARKVANQRNAGIGEVVSDIPQILAADARKLRDAAENAARDGRRAASERERQIEQELRVRRAGRGDE